MRPPALIVLLAAAPLLAQQRDPVAIPVEPSKTSSSHAVVAVQPVGKLPYDGVTIPLLSPGGRFFATQSGRTPSWETLLSDRGQSTPSGLHLSIYKLDFPAADEASAPDAKPDPKHTPRPPSLAPFKPAEPPPPGLLLGRSADERGFLIEAPQTPEPQERGASVEGARWIGRVQWLSGRLEWLVRGDRVNAQAVLPGKGPASLAFVRRAPGARAFDLVIHAPTNQEIIQSTPDAALTYAFPIFSSDGRTLGVLSLPADGAEGPLQLCAFDLTSEDGADAARVHLRPLGRVDLGRAPAESALHAAFQCVAALQSPAVLPPLGEGDAGAASPAREAFSRGLLAFSPHDGAMIWWEPHDDHVRTLARGSFAAAPFQHAEFGLVLAGPSLARAARTGRSGVGGLVAPAVGDLLYQPMRMGKDREPPEPLFGREVALVAGGSIPRATTLPGGITVLLGPPASGQVDAFDVVLMAPAKTDSAK